MIMYAGSEVESGLTSDLLKNPRHPYTKGLIAALPGNSESNSKNLLSIDGMPPELGNFPSGCAFHTRCKYAKESCNGGVPDVINLTPTHRIFCPVNPFTDVSNSGLKP
jgi:oligopeptide/dipeptide ABC transporter ATP-binding protein